VFSTFADAKRVPVYTIAVKFLKRDATKCRLIVLNLCRESTNYICDLSLTVDHVSTYWRRYRHYRRRSYYGVAVWLELLTVELLRTSNVTPVQQMYIMRHLTLHDRSPAVKFMLFHFCLRKWRCNLRLRSRVRGLIIGRCSLACYVRM
jgi:hypothetical protein